ncbi:hypothetical protein BCR44DRAFT_34068 [Catenaria anguillulae PL171]|uniref:NAD-dependent epimerase/dehydratase domain-containing protein n=1 Tax=Catenaria anguillulae PL171 TaxID=765915 RepID=A0A1Y2HYN1_9FUNG|nr:hypothetical protein BCR44DRAFT_34068 [Catenaria anguillulae PL171]
MFSQLASRINFRLAHARGNRLHSTVLAIAIFAWFTLNAAISSLISAYSHNFPLEQRYWFSSPWPLIIAAVHAISAGAVLYPLTPNDTATQSSRAQSFRSCLSSGACYGITLATANFAVFSLPHTVSGTLLISSFFLAADLHAQPWSLFTLSSLASPTGITVLALLFSIAAHATAIQLPTVAFLFAILVLTLKFGQQSFQLVLPLRSNSVPLALQLLCAGGLAGLVAVVVSFTTETQWRLTSSPCPGFLLLVLPAVCSAAITLIAYAAVENSAITAGGNLPLCTMYGLVGALALWHLRETASNLNPESTAALCLSAIAFGLVSWSVFRFARKDQDSNGYNQVDCDPEAPMRSPGLSGNHHGHDEGVSSDFEVRAFLLGSCILTAAALYLTFLLPCPVILGPSRVSFSNVSPSALYEPLHVLVTGGAGFVGSHFVRTFLASKAATRVTILDNLSTAGIHTIAPLIQKYGRDRVRFVYDNVANVKQVENLLLKSRVDAIVHLASPKVGDLGGCDYQCHRTIVDGAGAILTAVAKVQPSTRIIFASSSDVYGARNGASKSLAEYSRLEPSTPIAKALVEAEQLVFSHARMHSSPVFVLRLFPIVGPTAVPEPARINPRRWTRAGIGSTDAHSFEWVHITDVTDALYRALVVPPVPGMIGAHTFNIGSGLCAADSDAPCATADIAAAAHHLGYQPKLHRNDLAALESTLVSADPRDHPEYLDLVASLRTSPWLLPRNLLRSIHEPLANDLAAIAKHVSSATKNKITIMPYQKAYRPLAENTLHSLMTWGKVSNVMMFAIDAESARECLYYNIPCYNATTLAEADFTDSTRTSWRFQQAMWSVISWVKPRLVKQLLDLGYTVNMSDTDISYIRQVWESYEGYMQEADADMVISAEFINNFIANTGNYIVRPSPQVSSFFDEYLAVGKNDPTVSDQHAWAAVYRRLGMHYCQSSHECAAQRAKGLMPVRDHSAFFGRNIVCPRPVDICKPDIMYVHPICMGGRDNKINSIKSFGAWFMADEPRSAGYYCDEAKTAVGAAECIGVPKAVLKGYVAGMEDEWKKDAGVLRCLGSKAVLTNAENN